MFANPSHFCKYDIFDLVCSLSNVLDFFQAMFLTIGMLFIKGLSLFALT